MYMKLLEQTIKELKGEEIEDEIRANVNLRVDLRIDESYIPDMNQRLTVYRRIAAVRTDAGAGPADGRGAGPLRAAARFGPQSGGIRARSGCWPTASGSSPSTAKAQTVVLKFRPRREARPAVAVPGRPGARRRRAGAAGDAEAGPAEPPRRSPRRPGAAGPSSAASKAKGGRSGRGRVVVDGPGDGPARSPPGSPATRSCGRPRRTRAAEGGVFTRVGGLLRELSAGGLRCGKILRASET